MTDDSCIVPLKQAIQPPSHVEVRTVSAEKGRGVFTRRSIPQGSIVERAPVIVLSPADYSKAEKTFLYEYMFGWDDKATLESEVDGSVATDAAAGAIALGYGSLYNHAGTAANLRYICRYAQQIVEYVAIRDIEDGEELTINYQQRFTDAPLWFHEVQQSMQ